MRYFSLFESPFEEIHCFEYVSGFIHFFFTMPANEGCFLRFFLLSLQFRSCCVWVYVCGSCCFFGGSCCFFSGSCCFFGSCSFFGGSCCVCGSCCGGWVCGSIYQDLGMVYKAFGYFKPFTYLPVIFEI